MLLFKLSRPYEVASRGYSFIISFSKELVLHENILPFCTREIWIITAYLGLINATASRYSDGLVAPDIEKEFYHVQGDLYPLCQTKFIRLAYLIGYGSDIERIPANSASLSMLPWPKLAVWPSVPSDASCEVLEKEKALPNLCCRCIAHFGIAWICNFHYWIEVSCILLSDHWLDSCDCDINYKWHVSPCSQESLVTLLGRLHHMNLVNLVGYCAEKGQHMLIYVYRKGSLASHLYVRRWITSMQNADHGLDSSNQTGPMSIFG